jgi:hypothetical protein
MKYVLYSDETGNICHMLPCISADDEPGFTEEMALQRALAKDLPSNAVNVRVVDSLPEDRTFRNAWVDHANKIDISIDMAKAQTIALTEITNQMREFLKDLDLVTNLYGPLDPTVMQWQNRVAECSTRAKAVKAMTAQGVDNPADLATLKAHMRRPANAGTI